MNDFVQDIRYALRSFARQPGLTIIAVLSLGFGIGATSTVFTWLDDTVLNPLPAVPAYDRLVVVHARAPEGGFWNVSWPEFHDWRDGARSADLAGWDMMQLGLRDGSGSTERAWGVTVSGNYFDLLGVHALLGRLIRPDDEQRRVPVAVLGQAYWQRRFAADSGVIGRTITLNGSSFTIVGVAAPRFGGTYVGMDFHLYVPMTVMPLLMSDGTQLLQDRQRRSMYVIGRLKPGVSLAQAAAEVEPLAMRASRAAGLAQPLGAVLRSHGAVDAPAALRPVFAALLVMTGLVLLIACANVANLLLARAMARRREVAVRIAVGASRYRLVRQLLTESLVLAVAAGVLGMLLVFWGREALLTMMPAVPYPINLNVQINGLVVTFAAVVTAGTAIVFGLVPALQASKPELVPTLKDEIGAGRGGRGRLQSALVVTQVALSLLTLVTAGLFVRSLAEVRSIDTGMHGLDHVLLVGTDLRLTGIGDDSLNVSVVRRIVERVRALPGVEAAAVARSVVLGPSPIPNILTRIDGYEPRPDENMNVSTNVVTGDYFRTTGIREVQGRAISDADVSANAPVVVVNEAFARKYLHGRPPLGVRVNVGGEEWLSIVGVVQTSRYNSYTEDPLPVIFRPYSTRYAPAAFTLQVRAAGDPLALAPAVRNAFHEVGAELPFLDPRNMAEFTQLPYFTQKMGAMLLSAVGALALLLAAIGIYGAMSYAVSRRVREIGVRVALGAARTDVIGLVVGRGLRMTALGIVIGLAAAMGVGQLLRSMLYGVSPRDPLTFASVGLLLALVALAACALPARRAARVDPMVALRSE
ncbi:MAG TPA: ABC transporter permease [Gemmatimonadales bacterium]|jgi:predicted permease